MDTIILVALLAVVSLPIGDSTAYLINKYLDKAFPHDSGTVAATSLAWFTILVLCCVPASL